jgi:hypothetical protein
MFEIRLCGTATAHVLAWLQIIEKAMLSIDYIQTLPEPTKTIVIAAYSRGFEYAHGKSAFLHLFSTWG